MHSKFKAWSPRPEAQRASLNGSGHSMSANKLSAAVSAVSLSIPVWADARSSCHPSPRSSLVSIKPFFLIGWSARLPYNQSPVAF